MDTKPAVVHADQRGCALPLRTAHAPVTIARLQSEYLDALRGVAAQLVLLQHASTFCFPGRGYDRYGLGALGVLAFFLLSGFLITHVVALRLAQGRFSASEFLVGRFARIYTPYVPAIALVAALDWFASRSSRYEYAADYDGLTALANLSMLQDFPVFQVLRRMGVPEQSWFFRSFGSGRQFWTVSVEWWIYVVVGLGVSLAVAVTARRRLPPLLLAALAFAAVEPAYHLVGGPGDCLSVAWLLGGAAALCWRALAPMTAGAHGEDDPAGSRSGCPALPCAVPFLAFGACATLAAARLVFTAGRIYDAVFAALLACLMFLPLLPLGATSERLAPKQAGAARPSYASRPNAAGHLGVGRWLAFHSYSLYLTHFPLLGFVAAFQSDLLQGWTGLAAAVVACNMLAVPFALAFETPHRRVRHVLLRSLRVGPLGTPDDGSGGTRGGAYRPRAPSGLSVEAVGGGRRPRPASLR